MKTLLEVFNEVELNRSENLSEILKLEAKVTFVEEQLSEARMKLDKARKAKEDLDSTGHYLAYHLKMIFGPNPIYPREE